MWAEGFENLCNQVVLVAMQDLRRANNRLKRDPNDIEAQGRYNECIHFFKSDWKGQFTEVDGEWLIKMAMMDKATLKEYRYNVGAEGKKRGGRPKKKKEGD